MVQVRSDLATNKKITLSLVVMKLILESTASLLALELRTLLAALVCCYVVFVYHNQIKML